LALKVWYFASELSKKDHEQLALQKGRTFRGGGKEKLCGLEEEKKLGVRHEMVKVHEMYNVNQSAFTSERKRA